MAKKDSDYLKYDIYSDTGCFNFLELKALTYIL